MNMLILLKICLFLMLGIAAYFMLSYLKEHSALTTVAENVYQKAKAQEEERQTAQQRLFLVEGRQEKTNLLYKLDLLVLQSNMKKYVPFASTEILMIFALGMAAAGFALVTSITGTWVFGMLGFVEIWWISIFIIFLFLFFNI